MRIKDAIIFFETINSNSNKKREVKVYEEFLQILNGLKTRNFSESEILSIEIELDLLQLNTQPKNRRRFFKKALMTFSTYLNETHSLTLKGYYSGLGISLGSTFGMLFGMIVLSGFERSMGMVLGTIGGMLLGGIIGRKMDADVVAEGRAL